MSIVFAGKSFSGVVNDITNTYYTDPELNGRIGQGEKYIAEFKAKNFEISHLSSMLQKLESKNTKVEALLAQTNEELLRLRLERLESKFSR